MSKKAILFSAQNFSQPFDPQLKGCENDIKIWRKTLEQLGFNISDDDMRYDEKSDNAFSLFSAFIDDLNPEDTGVIFFSGHSINKQNYYIGSKIEGLLFEDRRVIYEYQLLQKLADLDPQAKLIMIADCCFARGLSKYKDFVLVSNSLQNIIDNMDTSEISEIIYEYKNNNQDITERVTFPVSAKMIKEHRSRIPERVIIPYKKDEVIDVGKIIEKRVIQACQVESESHNFSHEKVFTDEELNEFKGELISDENDNIDEVISRDIPISFALDQMLLYIEEIPNKVSHYPNITYILAEEVPSEKAYEKKFGNEGNYGVFTYYATKAILNNDSITYNGLKNEVNLRLSQETHEKVKNQRMAFDSGNDDWNRKLFT